MAETVAGDEPPAPLPERRADRKITVAHRVQYALARGVLKGSRALGVDRASAVGGWFAKTIGPFFPETRRADENLRAVFPDWGPGRRRRTIRRVWENLGRTAAEFAHLDAFDPSRPDGRLHVIGAEHFLQAVKKGPALFVSGHFANWEVMMILLQYSGIDFAILYRAANNPLVDELIIKTRAKTMSRLQTPKGPAGGRAMIEMMARGVSVAMLVDQKQNAGVTAPFLGLAAKTATTAARLALRFNTPIVAASVERLEGAHFRVRVREPIRPEPTGDFSADIMTITTKINDAIGDEIAARPEQWLWLHRRWPRQ